VINDFDQFFHTALTLYSFGFSLYFTISAVLKIRERKAG
jgi:hypothetical protein